MNQEHGHEDKQEPVKKSHFSRKFSEWNFKTFLLFGILLVLAVKVIFDFVGFRASIGEAFGFIVSLLSYLITGFILAYVLNAYIGWLERYPLRKMKAARRRRYLSIGLAYLTLVIAVGLLIFAIVPRLIDSVTDFAKIIPGVFDKVYEFYDDVVEGGKFGLPPSILESIEKGIYSMKDAFIGFFNVDRLASLGKTVVLSTGNGIFNFIMGLVVSVYMLLEKERALNACKRMVYGLFKPGTARNITEVGRKTDMVFKRYFAGKLLQALTILILSYIVLLIAGIDYAILFAVILGITNLIPYIGPWIGAVPVVAISLIQDPWMGLRALICILIIQGIDNWFITPYVVGGKMGISPLLVLIGLCIGGTLFGFVGMVIGDALVAIVKVVFYDTYVVGKLKKKVAAGELPAEYGETPDDNPEKPTLISKLWTRLRKASNKKKD